MQRSFSSSDFRATMSKFTTGILIVATANRQGHPIGVTINAFTSVSLDPPLVLFCLKTSSSSFNAFKENSVYSFNLLSSDQAVIAQNFSKYETKDWKNIDYDMESHGPPILKGCLANLICERDNLYHGGDHGIFLCKVVSLKKNDQLEPLIFFDRQYKSF